MALSITNLKKGTLFQMEGEPFRVVEYSQKVMGRGGSIVNVRIKSLIDGKVLEKTFKGNEQLETADVTNQSVQYLYNDGVIFYFMNGDTFEQFEISSELVGDGAGYLKEGDQVQLQFFDDRAINVELPKNVALEVTYTENAVKGDTTSSIQKEATLETGINIRVPAFIKQGDIVSVDTATGAYRERVKG
ncbi:MAG: elongation factor [Candidatus Saccharibacteria bacterium]|nr:elongation factor [Candidatus Saccharibacteria bacterium]